MTSPLVMVGYFFFFFFFFFPRYLGSLAMESSPANSSSASLVGRLGTALLRSELPRSFPKMTYGKIISLFLYGQ